MKFEGRDSAGEPADEVAGKELDEDELVVPMLLLFYMSYGAVRTVRTATSAVELEEGLPLVRAA